MTRSTGVLAVTFAAAILWFAPQSASSQGIWTDRLSEFKSMVVNIETSSEIVFETEEQGTSYGTGFIVDAALGLIAPNAPVAGTSPSYVKVHFHDGSFTEAWPLYYDPTHDFAFYQIDPDVPVTLRAVTLGSGRDLAVGDEVLLIGNNDQEEYSIKVGSVANLNVNKGDRHSSYIHSTFDRTGGSSGSPVWNAEGEVVAIHARGTETSSFELPIDYVVDALAKIRSGEPIRRGEIGVDLELITVGEAVRHFGLPESVVSGMEFDGSGTPRVMQVETLIPRTAGVAAFKPGDIVYAVNDEVLRDDLYRFDQLLNAAVGDSVSLTVYRNGERMDVAVPVSDMEQSKVRRFVQFAGATIHEITPKLRAFFAFPGDGVSMSYAPQGSSLSSIGLNDPDLGNPMVIISEFAGRPVRNLDDFIAAARGLEDGDHTYVISRDLMLYQSALMPHSVTLNLKYGPLGVFEWDGEVLDWVEVGEGRTKTAEDGRRR